MDSLSGEACERLEVYRSEGVVFVEEGEDLGVCGGCVHDTNIVFTFYSKM